MSRRLCLASCIALFLAIGCGGSGTSQTTSAGVTDPGADPGVDSPELPTPTASPEPTPTPTPTPGDISVQCDTQSALYVSPPSDGVPRPPSQLACVSQGLCSGIVLIDCSGTTVRVAGVETGRNVCRSAAASSVQLADFTVVTTGGTTDPATGETKVSGSATIATGEVYDYEVSVRYSEDGSMRGSGDVFGWPLVIEGSCH